MPAKATGHGLVSTTREAPSILAGSRDAERLREDRGIEGGAAW
jgi:hypothetical protein